MTLPTKSTAVFREKYEMKKVKSSERSMKEVALELTDRSNEQINKFKIKNII